MQMRMRRPGVRLVSIGVAAAVLGGVACSAIGNNLSAPGSNAVAPTGSGGSVALNVKGQPAPQVGAAASGASDAVSASRAGRCPGGAASCRA